MTTKLNLGILVLVTLALVLSSFLILLRLAEVKAQDIQQASILIDDGALYATSRSVHLDLWVANPSNFLVYGCSNFDDSSTVSRWESLPHSQNEAVLWSDPWNLLEGDGSRTVYFFLIDLNYNFINFSDTIVLDTSLPTGSIEINGGDEYATSCVVTLNLNVQDDGSGVSQMRFSDTGHWGSESEGWQIFSSTVVWPLPNVEGAHTVFCQIKDYVDRISQVFSDTIVLDTVAPEGSVSVNNGDEYTTSTSVTLTLTASDIGSGINQVRYSNDGVWDTESWEEFSSTKAWILTSGDGEKTVYYQISDKAGFVATFSDYIFLDTAAPTGSIFVNNNDEFANSTSVTLTLTASDIGSGINQVRYSNDGVWDTESWEPFSMTKVWTLSQGEDGERTVYYQIRDNVGIRSTAYADTIILDTTSPRGSITIDNGDDSTTSIYVTLQLTAEDATSGVDKVRYSNDGILYGDWESFSSTLDWNVTSALGSKTVYYQVRDKAQHMSTFNDTIVLEATTPSPTPTPASTPITTQIPTPTPIPTSTVPTPTPLPSGSPTPSNSPMPSSEPWNNSHGVIPPEAFYATGFVAFGSVAVIVFVTFRKPKSKEKTEASVRVPQQP